MFDPDSDPDVIKVKEWRYIIQRAFLSRNRLREEVNCDSKLVLIPKLTEIGFADLRRVIQNNRGL